MPDLVIPQSLIDRQQSFSGWIYSEEDATFGAAFPDKLLVPRSDWRDAYEEKQKNELNLKPFRPYIYNQNPTSACVYNSAGGCHMAIWNRTYGLKHQVILSPMSGYCQQTRRANSGSTMWGAMEHLTEVGLLPSSEHGQREKFKHTLHENHPFIQREQLPSGWQETAKIFRVEEWCRLDDPVQFASALLNDLPICYGRQGHCIMGGCLIYANGGKPYCEYCCSYGTSRGNGGWLYDSERMWSTGGAWCARSIKLAKDPAKPWEG